jgi:beta-lactamase regulating signal transducer with metallopeptidase domain
MIAMLIFSGLIFSGLAAVAVWLAGRRDAALDPRLTTLCLVLVMVFPLLGAWLPKLALLPAATVADASGKVGFAWLKLLWVLWVIGFVIAGLRLLLAQREVARWRAHSMRVAVVAGVEIRKLTGLRGPVAAGVWRRVVFVPYAWHDWTASTRQMVLDHELTHHRRRDPLWRWVAELACAVNWFNPAVAWMARRLSMQCEFACDAAVLCNGAAVEDYARLLCDCAEQRVPRTPLLAMADSATLESRVRRLVKPAVPVSTWVVACLIAFTLAAAATLALLGPEKSPDLAPKEVFTPQEVETRWSANPFPGER